MKTSDLDIKLLCGSNYQQKQNGTLQKLPAKFCDKITMNKKHCNDFPSKVINITLTSYIHRA